MQYRRARIKGGTYFFTVVTYQRERIFHNAGNIALLQECIQEVRDKRPFETDAFVLLPDHLHCVWTLPDGDCDFSTRWKLIKRNFSRRCGKQFKYGGPAQNEPAVWQGRFWEHAIRDEDDYVRHVEYIHYNPVKHGLVKAPKDWPHSSFRRYVEDGVVDLNWGAGQEMSFGGDVGRE